MPDTGCIADYGKLITNAPLDRAVPLGLTEHQGLVTIKDEALHVVRVRAGLGWGQSHITPFCPQPSTQSRHEH
jgi:hypothetical protein